MFEKFLEQFNTNAEYRLKVSDRIAIVAIFSGIGIVGLPSIVHMIRGNPISLLDPMFVSFGWLSLISVITAFSFIISGIILHVYLTRNIETEYKYHFKTKKEI